MHHSFTSFRTIYLVLPYDNGKLPRMVFTCLFLKLEKSTAATFMIRAHSGFVLTLTHSSCICITSIISNSGTASLSLLGLDIHVKECA